MANKKTFHRATFLVFLLSTLYYGVCFFAFIFIVNNVLIEFISSGKIDFSSKSLSYLSVVSAIVGVAAGARVWLFAKIDERKARRSSSIDRH
ncbi:hypothetical protein RNP97_003011 [Enterobacter bugandensis]|uniref:hypothetical protein n=1 Tax=Enterobacter TaxID=547 RepID=UPI000F842738|nr:MULTISPECIES: hypothetical protein [Enterobacter]ELF8872621.1 hypothetical protein [Enterobacter bugandensis]ELQ3995320.1 hypothetical protein [Enterobacter bugandensis]ELV3040539.1 hypothetical protein [Enterobacter bugandensis]ELX8413671.1 hypothetical protein [Enterobacter bugandensis]MDX7621930.1 hypothetical protein [Enterobacter bugandensis]